MHTCFASQKFNFQVTKYPHNAAETACRCGSACCSCFRCLTGGLHAAEWTSLVKCLSWDGISTICPCVCWCLFSEYESSSMFSVSIRKRSTEAIAVVLFLMLLMFTQGGRRAPGFCCRDSRDCFVAVHRS